MDMTMTKKQLEALDKFIEALVGEDPSFLDHSRAANDRRAKRAFVREWLHQFAVLNMRVGAHRARAALGLSFSKEAMPVWKDPKTGAEEMKVPIPDGEDKAVLEPRKH